MDKEITGTDLVQHVVGGMRSDKAKRHATFIALIEEIVGSSSSPARIFRDGYWWAALRQDTWASKLGVTVVTLREIAKIPPIRGLDTMTNGRRVKLYRVGPKPHVSFKGLARQMEAAFQAKYGRPVERASFGCLIGLAELWPSGHQVAIFRTVLDNLPGFMSLVRASDPESGYAPRYYAFLSCGLLRKYPDLALEMHVARLQELGKYDELSQLAPNATPLSMIWASASCGSAI